MKHSVMTRDSILKAIGDGAKTVSQIAVAHGYAKPVSGGVTAKIRTIVPEVAERLAGTYAEPVAKVAKAKVPKVPKAKKVKAPKGVVLQRKRPYGGDVYGAVFAEAVAAGRVQFRGSPEAFVEVTARKLNLSESTVFVAANVMRNPRHQSNGNRSKDVAGERGVMQLEPIVIEPVADQVAEPAQAAVAESVAS